MQVTGSSSYKLRVYFTMVWLFRFRDKKQDGRVQHWFPPIKKQTSSSPIHQRSSFHALFATENEWPQVSIYPTGFWAKNLFLKHDNRSWWFYQEVFLSGQLGICHAPKKIYQRSGKSPYSPDRKIWILQCLGFFFSVLSPFICLPRTQMTLVSIGKGLVSGGLTFKNRGHWGSR